MAKDGFSACMVKEKDVVAVSAIDNNIAEGNLNQTFDVMKFFTLVAMTMDYILRHELVKLNNC